MRRRIAAATAMPIMIPIGKSSLSVNNNTMFIRVITLPYFHQNCKNKLHVVQTCIHCSAPFLYNNNLQIFPYIALLPSGSGSGSLHLGTGCDHIPLQPHIRVSIVPFSPLVQLYTARVPAIGLLSCTMVRFSLEDKDRFSHRGSVENRQYVGFSYTSNIPSFRLL